MIAIDIKQKHFVEKPPVVEVNRIIFFGKCNLSFNGFVTFESFNFLTLSNV